MSPFLLLAVGCSYDEHLPEVDIHGTVRIPKEAASVTLQTGEVISDPRLIGPVVLGAYPSVRDDLFAYPHPEMGPVIDEGIPGNTYPYGGGTVGRFDFACYEALACEIVTGRFKDYEDVIDFHQNVLGEVLVDDQGQVVETPGFYQQSCFDLLEITSDYEMSWISGDEGLHFTDAGDFYEAEFDLWQVEYREGMQVWGWLDRPAVLPGTGLQYSTCDKDQGQTNNEYTNDYAYGTAHNDLLNFPGTYIAADDYVASMDQVWTATEPDSDAFRESDEDIVIDIDFLFEGY